MDLMNDRTLRPLWLGNSLRFTHINISLPLFRRRGWTTVCGVFLTAISSAYRFWE